MRIYRVVVDVQRFQTVVPTDERAWSSNQLRFDAKSKESWEAVSVVVFNPTKTRGNFFHLSPSVLVCDDSALGTLEDVFERAGEVLPVQMGQETLYLINVLECANSLDALRCQWRYDPQTGQRLSLAEYAFARTRLPESSVFKIPETAAAEVLTYSEVKGADDELIRRYQAAGLTGLVFQSIFED